MSLPIVIVSGPTACGKTDLVHRLAKPGRDVIINCDSRQFYRWLNIGTAKPSSDALSHYQYRLVDFLDPGQSFSAYDFLKRCVEEVKSQHRSDPSKRIFLVGGSMFYVDVLKKGLPIFPPTSPETKSRIQRLWEEKGIDHLTGLLKERDPDFYREVDLRNHRRVIRALEVLEGGVKVSELRKKREPPPWKFLEIIPIFPRKIINQRIDERIVQMMKDGWIDEVRDILKRFSSESLRQSSAIGYSDILNHLEGKMGYHDTVSRIQQKTRLMAKQQLTWLKKEATGFLILHTKTGYNLDSMFNRETYEFIDPTDEWINRYPRALPATPLPKSALGLSPPLLLISDDLVVDVQKRIDLFYE